MSASCNTVDGTTLCNSAAANTVAISPYSNHSGWLSSPSTNVSFSATNASSSHAAFSRPRGHEDYGPQINFAVWFLTSLTVPFLVGRLYCKTLRHRGLWWDDYVLVASWLALAIQCAFVSVTVSLGLGRPMDGFNYSHLTTFLLCSNLAGSFSIIAAAWSKTSFAITVLRISNGWIKRIVWFVMVSVNIALGLSVVFTWVHCKPVQKVWSPFTDGECWPIDYIIHYNTFTAAYSGAMDIILAILPWKIIGGLTMNKKEKFGVLVAMSMGVFAGATSLVKISSIPGIANTSFTDAPIQLVLLGAAESATTIIAASIPILRALVRDTGPDLKTPPAEPRALEGQQQHGTDSESTARLSWNTTRSNSWISSDTDLDKLKNRLSDLSLTGEHGKGLQEGEMVGDYEKYQPSDVGKGI